MGSWIFSNLKEQKLCCFECPFRYVFFTGQRGDSALIMVMSLDSVLNLKPPVDILRLIFQPLKSGCEMLLGLLRDNS